MNLNITGATLLSIEEANCLSKRERKYNCFWWLRSPAYHSDQAAGVVYNGDISKYGSRIDDWCGSVVRPALIINNLESSELKIGDIFEICGYEFKIIADNLAWMHKQDIGEYPFNKIWEKDDNDYNTSYIKEVVDNWFNDCIKSREIMIVKKLGDETAKNKQPLHYSIDDVNNVILLSCDEWEAVQDLDSVPSESSTDWWLRSCGRKPYRASTVWDDGECYWEGDDVDNLRGVRPAFNIINLESEIGDKVFIDNTLCTTVDKNCVLCDTVICQHVFDDDWSNDFISSSIYKFINSPEFKEIIRNGNGNEEVN